MNIARRCRLLYQARFLERPRAVRPLKILNEELVYALGKRGALLLQDRDETLRIGGLDWAETPSSQNGMLYIDHQLRIADVMVALATSCSSRGITLEWDGHFERRRYRVRPPGGAQTLFPDAVFSLSEGNTRVTYLLEADRGNVSVQRMRVRYLGYFQWWRHVRLAMQRGALRDLPSWQRAIQRVRVVTITKSPTYMNKLRREASQVGRTPRHESWRALMFSHYRAFDLDAPEKILGNIFLRPTSVPREDDEAQALFPTGELRSS